MTGHSNSVLQRRTAVTYHLRSKQLLWFTWHAIFVADHSWPFWGHTALWDNEALDQLAGVANQFKKNKLRVGVIYKIQADTIKH